VQRVMGPIYGRSHSNRAIKSYFAVYNTVLNAAQMAESFITTTLKVL